MNRRRFLEFATAANISILTGCASQPSPQSNSPAPTDTPTRTDTHTTTVTRTATNSPTTESTTESPTPTAADSGTIYVGPEGTPGDGSREDPVKNFQEALERAQPGETIYVKPGQYFESPKTKRAGEPGNPITITGPPDAVVSGKKGAAASDGLSILHSHIHITGLTFDGLQDPSREDESDAYMSRGVVTSPEIDRRLTDIVIKPHAAGNVRYALIVLEQVTDVEVGEFKLIGPTGQAFLLGDEVGHYGEIVYVGPGEKPVKDVHIHHIDNSAGHHHVEGFPDVKMNAHNVLFEYNTTFGGRLPSDNDHGATGHLGGHNTVFRWNRLGSPVTRGVDVGNYREEPPDDFPKAGTRNSIYGNEFVEFGGKAIRYTAETSESKQRTVCGNTVNGETDGDPSKGCSDDIPATETIGHLGGDSPWA